MKPCRIPIPALTVAACALSLMVPADAGSSFHVEVFRMSIDDWNRLPVELRDDHRKLYEKCRSLDGGGRVERIDRSGGAVTTTAKSVFWTGESITYPTSFSLEDRALAAASKEVRNTGSSFECETSLVDCRIAYDLTTLAGWQAMLGDGAHSDVKRSEMPVFDTIRMNGIYECSGKSGPRLFAIAPIPAGGNRSGQLALAFALAEGTEIGSNSRGKDIQVEVRVLRGPSGSVADTAAHMQSLLARPGAGEATMMLTVHPGGKSVVDSKTEWIYPGGTRGGGDSIVIPHSLEVLPQGTEFQVEDCEPAKGSKISLRLQFKHSLRKPEMPLATRRTTIHGRNQMMSNLTIPEPVTYELVVDEKLTLSSGVWTAIKEIPLESILGPKDKTAKGQSCHVFARVIAHSKGLRSDDGRGAVGARRRNSGLNATAGNTPTVPTAVALRWETDFTKALADAKQQKRLLCFYYSPNPGNPEVFNDPLVRDGLKEVVCVQAFKEQEEVHAKFRRTSGGYPNCFIIDSNTERVLATVRGGITAYTLLKAIIEARSKAGLPLTPEMQRSVDLAFDPDQKLIEKMTTAGDINGLVDYLKQAQRDEIRVNDYLVIGVKYPPSVNASDVVVMLAGANPEFPPSGVCLKSCPRSKRGWDADVKIDAPGCLQINDQVPMDGDKAVLSREYTLEPLPLTKASGFSGRVLRTDDSPVERAIVRICDQGVVARTDSSGRFHLRDISPGTHLVRAEAPGGEFQATLEFEPGESIQNDLILDDVTTVGIRWVLQTKEGSLDLDGPGTKSGEAHFSMKHSRFLLERGAETREYWGSDFMLKEMQDGFRKHVSDSAKGEIDGIKNSTPVFWLFDAGRHPSGLHREQDSFESITQVNGGKSYDERSYFEFLRGYPVRKGDVFTLRTVRKNCHAKIEIIDVTLRIQP